MRRTAVLQEAPRRAEPRTETGPRRRDARSTMPMAVSVPVHPGLEALEDGFYMLDGEGRVTYWNAAAQRLLGPVREQVLGRPLTETAPALAGGAFGRGLAQARQSGDAVEFSVPHPEAGRGRYLSVRVSPLDDGGVAVHCRDATAEAQLAERYADLLESIRDGFIGLGADGSIVYMNGVAERLLRLSRERTLGRKIWPLLPREPAEIERALRATLADGRPRSLQGLSPRGAVFAGRVFDLWVHPVPGGGLSMLFQDVSERVQREKELARYAAEAEEANRAKSRFFAAVSHELRTPLNALVGYTHLLSTETYGALPPAAVRAASRAGVCAEHLGRMIDDLLLMTTAEVDQLPVVATPLELRTYLPGVIEPIRQQAEAKGLRFAVEVAPETPVIETDPDRLRQLLHALLSNAVKFTSRGGVRLHVAPAPAEEAGAAGVRIRVIDTGPGIPEAERGRIFEAFEQIGDPARSDSLRHGPGLGLTIARRLATLLAGSLLLEQSGSDGSVFRVDLPLRLPLPPP